jgi:uncharacterized cupredoxin-like copper-binding protein
MRRALVLAAMTSMPLAVAQAHDTMPGMDVGRAGTAQAVTRTVDIVMNDDMRFTPSAVTVDAGQTVRFVVRNAGTLRHEFILGNAADIAGHAAMMRGHPGTMHHGGGNSISLEAGKNGSVIWRFGAPGTVTFACLEAGHFEAGMQGTIEVRPAARK